MNKSRELRVQPACQKQSHDSDDDHDVYDAFDNYCHINGDNIDENSI